LRFFAAVFFPAFFVVFFLDDFAIYIHYVCLRKQIKVTEKVFNGI